MSHPVRFLFILLGPVGSHGSFHEIGRAMATLMSDEIFHEVAYRARKRDHLLAGIDEFLDAVTVLPPGKLKFNLLSLVQIQFELIFPNSSNFINNNLLQFIFGITSGEWDPTIRIEPPAAIPSQDIRKHPQEKPITKEINEEIEEERIRQESGLLRTGIIFGGLKNDLRRKVPWYWSDFKDSLNAQCIASWIFLYFACLSPIITFGGLLGTGRICLLEKTIIEIIKNHSFLSINSTLIFLFLSYWK